MIGAVFFDVDDTLVDFGTSSTVVLEAVLGPGVDRPRWDELSEKYYPMFTRGELSFEAMRVARLTQYLRESGRPVDDAAAIEEQRMGLLQDSYVLYDDALPCVRAIRDLGIPVGLITNNDAGHQRRKLTTVGLDGLFDAVVISGAVGFAKPDARIFALACSLLDVAPADAVHVGDNPEADVLGAHAAGLRAVWLNRGLPRAPLVDVEVIAGLAELVPLLSGALATDPRVG